VTVTIITPTWGRLKTLFERAIPSVAAQDYPAVEHLVVTDGYDADLNAALAAAGYSGEPGARRLVTLGRNWSAPEVCHGGVGAIPRLVGAFMASGDYIGYCDDDNALYPHHVSTLVKALEDSGADFACSRWHQNSPAGPAAGGRVPARGQTDTTAIMHRASILRHGSWSWADGYEADGALVERWRQAGCSWVSVDEPTFVLYPHRLGAPD